MNISAEELEALIEAEIKECEVVIENTRGNNTVWASKAYVKAYNEIQAYQKVIGELIHKLKVKGVNNGVR